MNKEVLNVLDHCAQEDTFPMLDNGYVHLAATRLCLYRSETNKDEKDQPSTTQPKLKDETIDWALTIEIFGYSPRSRLPDTHIYTFASGIAKEQRSVQPTDFDHTKDYEDHLRRNSNNEIFVAYPCSSGDWQSAEHVGEVSRKKDPTPTTIPVRGKRLLLPKTPDGYATQGIDLEDSPNVFIEEACRFLAVSHREDLLATEEERRRNVPTHLTKLMQLDEWHHPDISQKELPSSLATFQQLADVLASGDKTMYKATAAPNTHWSNWRGSERL